jgi:hypothetical protein
MKSSLILSFLFALALSMSGQAANQVFATDSTKGNENVYFTGTKEAGIYQGVVGFVFQTSHDSATIYFQGCYNTSDWRTIDTIAPSGASTVNQITYQTPPLWKYYRLWADGNTGDTCIISNCRYFLKY